MVLIGVKGEAGLIIVVVLGCEGWSKVLVMQREYVGFLSWKMQENRKKDHDWNLYILKIGTWTSVYVSSKNQTADTECTVKSLLFLSHHYFPGTVQNSNSKLN